MQLVNCVESMKLLLSTPFVDPAVWLERLQSQAPIVLPLVFHLVVDHIKKPHLAFLLSLSQHFLLLPLRHLRLSLSLELLHPCPGLASVLTVLFLTRRLIQFNPRTFARTFAHICARLWLASFVHRQPLARHIRRCL